MKKQFITLVFRWLVNCLGLWAAAELFNLVNYQQTWSVILVGGLLLALLNALIKPILIIFTLPAIALTLGLFLIIINGFIVYLVSLLYGPLQISSFWAALLVGIVIGLVNYIVTIVAEAITHNNE
jgi:putative membrane protein